MYTCPVCFYPEMPDPPKDYHICPCCGTEFGNDDEDYSSEELRNLWVHAGTPWFFGVAPEGWSAEAQLLWGELLLEEIRLLQMSGPQSAAMAAAADAGASAGAWGAVGSSSLAHFYELTSSSFGTGKALLELVAAGAVRESELGEGELE